MAGLASECAMMMALYSSGDRLCLDGMLGLQVTMTRFGSIRVDEREGRGAKEGGDVRQQRGVE
jgi:hypothetical protein